MNISTKMKLIFIQGQDCHTCHAMKPMVERICNKEQIDFEAVDVETIPKETLDFYQVQGLPTLILLDADSSIDDIRCGSMTPSELTAWIRKWSNFYG